MNNKLTHSTGPLQAWTAALVFLLPFLSLVTLFGVSATSFLFLLSAMPLYLRGRAAVGYSWPEVRWVVFAFFYYFAFAALCYMVRPVAPLSNLEKPARMFFAISALMLVLVARPSRRALWWGVIAGALVALPQVAWQRIVLDIERPGGLLNAITFGDLSLCLALLALAAAVDFRSSTRQAVWPALGALAGLAGSVLSGTRGGWIALALALVVFVRHGHLVPSRRVRALLAASFALFAVAWFVPALGMQERVLQGVSDVRTWMDGGSAFSNVGIRLELWKGAAMLVSEHPWFGLDPAEYKAQLAQWAVAGKIDRVVLTMPHMHNDALQALVTGGLPGLLAWFGIMAAPFAFFAKAMRSGAGGAFAPALAGMLLVVCYFSFGLTEVIFWSVKGSLFYALMVFLLMGFCLIEKERIGK
ncbi:O-antigen ligase [Massilia terrae]|uniref:O-antigen ligase family protein n=1 Tax=Massilia terrae TaxID=1811224 RepID=A0ABT2CWP1_9BURK|nr:O-antigen ligase family protein [Massilia terrae]MCS0658382.1 O-antigen ligase family protein [Massilia terrae]